MILCCAHCEEPIPPRRLAYDDMFCSGGCAEAFGAEMIADAGVIAGEYGDGEAW